MSPKCKGPVVRSNSMSACLASVLLAGCASTPESPAELIPDCEELFATAPEGTAVASEDMPRLLNPGDVHRRLTWLYEEEAERTAVVQLLVQPDGSISHGCVRQRSGDVEFDRAVLEAARTGRFRPAQLHGRPVAAWVVMPMRLGGP